MATTRSEYMAWCKRRALAYLPADPSQAMQSMMSDLSKHEETATHPAIMLTQGLLMGGHLETAEQVRKHIEGFN